ncbi:MAG: hypothetical protein ACRDRE_18455 [Pseudonocardiaceae bacterium]
MNELEAILGTRIRGEFRPILDWTSEKSLFEILTEGSVRSAS